MPELEPAPCPAPEPGKEPGPGWQPLATALPVASAAIALLELTRVPGQSPERSLAALAELVRGAASSFAVPALLVALAAFLVGWSTERRRLRVALLFGVGFAQAALAREVLIEDPPFAWSVPVALVFVVLGAGLGALHLWVARPRRGAFVGGVALALGSLLFARAHYTHYVGQYPTLHQACLQLSFVGCALGLGLAIGALDRPAVARRVAVVAAAMLLCLAFVELPASAWARPVVMAYTELGRGAGVAAALERDRAFLLPEALPTTRHSELLRPDDDAEARFAAAVNLPPLEVALEDYDVLLVVTEATRFDRTSLSDPELGTTPALERFARRGAHVFSRAYSPSNGTFPSLASMFAMTPVSFAPIDARRRFWRGGLREGRPSAVEAMRDAGRATFWVGHDHERCFSEHAAGLERGFDRRVLIEETRGDPSDIDVDERVADAAVEALEAQRRRFFGLVFFVSPHDDYRDGYDGELRRFDRAFARVLDAVDLSRTIVVVTSDHGEAFEEHGHQHHLTSVYDEQIHVPLLVWIPGAPGDRHTMPTSTAYVLPWLLLRGAEPEREAVRRVLREDVGPLLRALDGAVISEMIGPQRQQTALIWEDTSVVYDVLANLVRVFDARRDPRQLHDLREDDPARLERVLPFVRRYRRARYDGRRFRFVMEGTDS